MRASGRRGDNPGNVNALDCAIVALYLGAMLWLGRRYKRHGAGDDYFLGGRRFGWFSLCMSAMATQLSAISFVSAPAFVGLREGGGMQWLAFEFAVPLAMIVVMVWLGPALHGAGVVSAYAWLERRLGRGSRTLVSALFVLSRGLGTGVSLYTIGLILASILGVPFWQTMLVLGVVTIVYSLEGGMRAVVYSEVAQMFIKVLGLVVILLAGLRQIGGWDAFLAKVDRARIDAVDFASLGFDGGEFGFWPMLVGGLFLYVSYYGTDQTQAQRILAARDGLTVRRLLLFNGLLRFPIALCFCLGGLVLGTLALHDADFRARIPADQPDLLVPVFIAGYLPNGVIGLIVVALIAAWMSSYSSALNSLTAVTMEDFFRARVPPTSAGYVRVSKLVALGWGAFTMGFGFFTGKIAATAIEAINKIGSVFYGPILGVFVLAALGPRVRGAAANVGVLAGVAVNLALWVGFKDVFWLWWNVIGGVTTVAVGLAARALLRATPSAPDAASTAPLVWPRREIAILGVYFVLIVSFSLLLPQLLRP